MTATTTLSIGCANCNTEFEATVQTIINGQDLGQKAAFVQDQLNLLDCPNCQENLQPVTPLYYYDLEKGLALALVPAELALPEPERRAAATELATTLVNSLPKKQRKHSFFEPQVFDTHEAMVSAIFAADGVTPAMVATQTVKAQLIEDFLSVDTDEIAFQLRSDVHDAELDAEFFEILTAYMQAAQLQGDEAKAKMYLDVRTQLGRLRPSRQAMIAAIDAKLGLTIIQDQNDLFEKLKNAPTKAARKPLVVVGFDLLDENFFKLLKAKLEEAAAGSMAEQKVLRELRNDILELKAAHTKESQATLENAEALFKEVIQADTPAQVLKHKVDQLDETFFFVLGTNIAKARQHGQDGPAQALEMLGQVATGLLQERKARQQ